MKPRRRRPDQGAIHQSAARLRHPSRIGQDAGHGGIDRSEISGYYTEEFTHLAVAAAIAGGVADVGLGIEAAARKLKMDFIPLFHEDYYLLAKREIFERADVEAIVASLKSEEFAAHVRGIPGYDTAQTGKISNVSDVIG